MSFPTVISVISGDVKLVHYGEIMAENEVMTEETVEEKTDKKSKKSTKACAKNEELERVKAELANAQAEAEENKRKWYAVSAEYENYRRRTQAQSAQRYQEGRNDVLSSLFPIGDNLARAGQQNLQSQQQTAGDQ